MSHPTRPGLGSFLCSARTRAGLSQRELSQQIGRSPAYVSKLEADQIEPSFIAVADIAFALRFNAIEVWTLCRIALQDRHTRMVDSSDEAA